MTPPGRTERKKEDTRQKIVAAALQLFGAQGVEATTMEQIAQAADVARGTLYNYFPVKEAIIAAYFERLSHEQNAARLERLKALPDTRTRMTQALHELMRGVRMQEELFERYFVYRIQTMISLRRDSNVAGGLQRLETGIIRLGQESGEIRTDLPLDLLEGLFEFVFIKTAQQYYQDPRRFDAAEAIEQGVDLFMNGVSPQP